ncbi:hypothetical protein PoB_006606200 [Plakobranchus ocellatus]|uniref:SWIM-type domain-containing protein n=1 Tax=Plakobranchus ocellatus TaxID=259542 RepID=A0AAV4D5S9_9GAST|nr:hypothetical protein PoB_006606200 [Plakobranchus ocellatus]
MYQTPEPCTLALGQYTGLRQVPLLPLQSNQSQAEDYPPQETIQPDENRSRVGSKGPRMKKKTSKSSKEDDKARLAYMQTINNQTLNNEPEEPLVMRFKSLLPMLKSLPPEGQDVIITRITEIDPKIDEGKWYFLKRQQLTSLAANDLTIPVFPKEGSVKQSSCNCKASALRRCIHVASLFFAIDAYIQKNGCNPPARTSIRSAPQRKTHKRDSSLVCNCTGFWVSGLHPELGCSPDGLVINSLTSQQPCSPVGAKKKKESEDAYKAWYSAHKPSCTANHEGSSGMMEVEASRVM